MKVNMSEEESCPEHQEASENKERVTTVTLHESKLEKTFRAFCLNGAILSVGLSVAFIGTALPDLQDRTKTGIDDITKTFIVRGLGFLVGVIFTNCLFRQATQACWITIALFALAATMVVAPGCVNLAFLMGTLFIQGTACGTIRAGCGIICQNHFSADVTWCRMLFLSFGIGTFLAPSLLLPFTGINTETSKFISLHSESMPLHSSTVFISAVPSRRDLIAPHILARKRRNAVNEMLENFTTEALLSQFTSDELNTSTVRNLINVDESTEHEVSSKYERKSTDFSHAGLINATVDMLFSNDSRQMTSDTNTTVALIINASSAVLQLSTTTSTSAAKLPTKPLIANGEILDAHRDVADSSKFRNQIRQNLNKGIPDVVAPAILSSTSTFSTVLANTSSVAMQNFSLYPSGRLSSTAKVNVSGVQIEKTAADSDVGSLKTKALLLSPHPSVKWSSSYTSTLSSETTIPSPILKSSLASSPNPSVATKDINLKSSLFPSALISNTLRPSTVSLLKSRPASTSPSILSLDSHQNLNTPVPDVPKPIIADTLNYAELAGKPTRLTLLWLSKYSYWIAAIFIGLAATAFTLYWVLCPRVYQVRLAPNSDDPSRITMTFRFSAVFVAITFHMLYAGLEASLAILVTSYAVNILKWSWRFGVLLSLVFWGSFSVGRLVQFVFFRYLRQSVLLFGSLLACITVAGGAFISFQPGNNVMLYSSGFVIWLLVGALGFAMSAILPSAVAEIDKFLPHHSEFFQVFGASLGEMMLPPVIGSVMATSNTIWLAYILLAVFVLCVVISVVVRFLVVRSSEVRVSRTSRLLPSSEQDDLEDVLTSTNDETELLSKSMYSQTGSSVNGHANGSLPATSSAIQSLMKNIGNVKRD